MDNIIESYLVSIGYLIDRPSVADAKSTLGDVEDRVAKHATSIASSFAKTQEFLVKSFTQLAGGSKATGSILTTSLVEAEKAAGGFVKTLIGYQVAVTGAFFGIGAAVVDLAKNTADADFHMQIMASRSLMSVGATRAMTDALKALGLTYDDLAVSQEARERYRGLSREGKAEEAEYGFGDRASAYTRNMKALRDIEQGYARLTVLGGNLTSAVVSDLVTALAPTLGGPLKWLNSQIDKWVKDIPHLAQVISDTLTPILKEAWVVLKDLGHAAKLGLEIFQELVGLFSGDSSLKDAPVTFDSISKAVLHVVDGMDWLLNGIINVEKAFLHLIKAAADFAKGDFSGALKEMTSSVTGISPAGGAIAGAGLGTTAGAGVGAAVGGVASLVAGPFAPLLAPVTVSAGAAVGSAAGGAVGGIGGYQAGKIQELRNAGKPWIGKAMEYGLANSGYLAPLWERRYEHDSAQAAGQGEDRLALQPSDTEQQRSVKRILQQTKGSGLESLMLGLGLAESSLRHFDQNGKVLGNATSSAQGLFQILKGTARDLGVNAGDPDQNVSGAFSLIKSLLAHYHGDERLAIEAYHDGRGAVDAGHVSTAAYQEATRVMAYEQQFAPSVAAGERSIDIGKIEVNITHPGATDKETQAAVQRGVSDAIQRHERKQAGQNISQLTSAYGF
jgi:hypothetical protein